VSELRKSGAEVMREIVHGPGLCLSGCHFVYIRNMGRVVHSQHEFWRLVAAAGNERTDASMC